MTVREAIGFAAIDGGQINIKTVSDTRRAAMINWLVTERNVMIYNAMTDEHVERLWFHFRGTADIEYVTITRTHGPGEGPQAKEG